MADAMKLLPCPFCGGEAALLDYEARYGGLHYASRCPQCASCGCSMGYLPTAKKAVEAWNCRAPIPAPEKAPSFDDARRKLIHCIEQWDGETEYDAEDIAALADDILDVFASPPAREEAPDAPSWRDEYNRVEAIREAADGQDRIARSTADPLAKSDAETQAAGYWSRYEREVAKLNKEAPAEGAGEVKALTERLFADAEYFSDLGAANSPTWKRMLKDIRRAATLIRNRTSEPEEGGRPDFTVTFGGDAIGRDMAFLQRRLGKGPVGVVRHAVSCFASHMGADAPDRTSEPEAGAVAWRWRYDDEGLTNWSYGPYSPSNKGNQRGIMEPCKVQPLYDHPAPATADKLREIAKGLNVAMSWVDYPFVENNTPVDEIRQRLGFMQKDAEPHRQALATLNEQPQ